MHSVQVQYLRSVLVHGRGLPSYTLRRAQVSKIPATSIEDGVRLAEALVANHDLLIEYPVRVLDGDETVSEVWPKCPACGKPNDIADRHEACMAGVPF